MPVDEVLASYGRALVDNVAWLAVAVIASLAYVRIRRPVQLPPRTSLAVLVVLSILAIAWAWHLRWLADDAFISFRYARNWVAGNGLVFNVGERVEAYTNFLWVALLAGADALGLDIPTVAIVLCLASHVGVLVMTTRLVRRLAPDTQPVVVSLAAVVLATSYLAATFATGGLETTFGALLVLGALECAQSGRTLAAGALGIAATMAHPDHAIFYVALGGVLAFRRTKLRDLALYAAPFVVVYVPYFLVRWHYFGLPLPNSFYAKSGGGSYFDQGAFYLLASAIGAGLLGILPLAVHGVVLRRRTLLGQFAIVAVPLYLVYVAKIGGDYMLGRLLIPVLPIGLAFAEVSARELIAQQRWRLAAPALAVASLACVPTRIIEPQQTTWFLTDERTFHGLDTLQPLVLKGDVYHRIAILEKYFGDLQPAPVYAAYAIGILGWVTDWRIIDLHGLLDPELARQPLQERGRPGHEHLASRDYIFRKGADLSALGIFGSRHDALSKVTLDGETFSLTRYAAGWLDPLRGNPNVQFVHFPEYIDEYIATLASKSPEDRQRDLVFFDRYYFASNPDPERRAKLRRR